MRAIEISGTNRSQAITLPVNPLSFEISQGQVNQTVTLLNMGEVNLLGNRGLITVSFSSLFPASPSTLARYADREPEEYISQLQKWKNRKKTVRLIIGGTDINFAASIERLATTYKEGDRDVYYTLELKEYRQLDVPAVQMPSAVPKDNGLNDRPDTNTAPRYHTVKSQADTLWYMACKYYGDGTQWTKISAANNNQDPKLLQLGDRMLIP